MTTNVANPILYAWLNPTFKKLFLKALRERCGGAKGRGSPMPDSMSPAAMGGATTNKSLAPTTTAAPSIVETPRVTVASIVKVGSLRHQN